MINPGKASVVGASLAAPGVAFAHSPIEGIDSFYNGLLHPVFVPAHLLLLIALGLFIGQQGPKENQAAIAAFLVATAVGLTAAWFGAGGRMEAALLSAAALVGMLIAANRALEPYPCAFIAALAGLLLGMDSDQETLSDKEKLVSLFGSGVGVYLLLLYPMALADSFKKKAWQKIGVRVVGSWVAASSLLVLALSLSSVSAK